MEGGEPGASRKCAFWRSRERDLKSFPASSIWQPLWAHSRVYHPESASVGSSQACDRLVSGLDISFLPSIASQSRPTLLRASSPVDQGRVFGNEVRISDYSQLCNVPTTTLYFRTPTIRDLPLGCVYRESQLPHNNHASKGKQSSESFRRATVDGNCSSSSRGSRVCEEEEIREGKRCTTYVLGLCLLQNKTAAKGLSR